MSGWKSVHYKRLEQALELLSDACVDAVAEKPPPPVAVRKKPISVAPEKIHKPTAPAKVPSNTDTPDDLQAKQFFKDVGWDTVANQTAESAVTSTVEAKPAIPIAKPKPEVATTLPPVVRDETSAANFFQAVTWSGTTAKDGGKLNQPIEAEVAPAGTEEYFEKANWTSDSTPVAKSEIGEDRKLSPASHDEVLANGYFQSVSWSAPSTRGDSKDKQPAATDAREYLGKANWTSSSPRKSSDFPTDGDSKTASAFLQSSVWDYKSSDAVKVDSKVAAIAPDSNAGTFMQSASWHESKAMAPVEQPVAKVFFKEAAWSASSNNATEIKQRTEDNENEPLKIPMPRAVPPIPAKPMTPRPRAPRAAPRGLRPLPPLVASTADADAKQENESLHMEISGNPEDAPDDSKSVPEHRNILFAGLMSAANTSKKILRNLSNSKNKKSDKE